MQLEFHQLDLRYEALRARHPRKERRLLGSLAQQGQQWPIVVVGGEQGAPWVVVDGYKRVRALRQLHRDCVEALPWELSEADALMLEGLMRSDGGPGPLQQGWLLRELRQRFGLTQHDLAARFDKSVSWVSRRLGLVEELPEAAQSQVRAGTLGAHAAMRYLVPLARAKRRDCEALLTALSRARSWPSSRDLGRLYEAWRHGPARTRELVVSDPWLYLRAEQHMHGGGDDDAEQCAAAVLRELEVLSAVALRARRRVHQGLLGTLPDAIAAELRNAGGQARNDTAVLFAALDEELHAG